MKHYGNKKHIDNKIQLIVRNKGYKNTKVIKVKIYTIIEQI